MQEIGNSKIEKEIKIRKNLKIRKIRKIEYFHNLVQAMGLTSARRSSRSSYSEVSISGAGTLINFAEKILPARLFNST